MFVSKRLGQLVARIRGHQPELTILLLLVVLAVVATEVGFR